MAFMAHIYRNRTSLVEKRERIVALRSSGVGTNCRNCWIITTNCIQYREQISATRNVFPPKSLKIPKVVIMCAQQQRYKYFYDMKHNLIQL